MVVHFNFGGLTGESNLVCSVTARRVLPFCWIFVRPSPVLRRLFFWQLRLQTKRKLLWNFFTNCKKNHLFLTFVCYACAVVHVLYVPHFHPFHLWHHLIHQHHHHWCILCRRSLTPAVKYICPVDTILQEGWGWARGCIHRKTWFYVQNVFLDGERCRSSR